MVVWPQELLERLRNIVVPPLAEEVASFRRRWLDRAVAVLGAFALLGLSAGVLLLLFEERWGLFAMGYGLSAAALAAALYVLLRYDYLWWAAHIPPLAAWAGVSGLLWFGGWGGILGAAYALAVVLAVVLAGPVGGVLWAGASVLAYAVIGDPALAALRGDLFPAPDNARVDVVVLGVVWGLLLVLVAGLERRLRVSAAQRAREARQHSAEREATVRGRQELLAQFARQVDRERALLAAVQEVATPVLPLDQGTVLVPVSGRLDEERADRLIDAVLAGVEAYSADLVLIDVSTLVAVDAEAAAHLIRALRGARLVGSACVLVGVQPAVARALASLDVDLASIPTYATLREGLSAVRPPPPPARARS